MCKKSCPFSYNASKLKMHKDFMYIITLITQTFFDDQYPPRQYFGTVPFKITFDPKKTLPWVSQKKIRTSSEISNNCLQPCTVASAKICRFFLNIDSKGIFFYTSAMCKFFIFYFLSIIVYIFAPGLPSTIKRENTLLQ